MTNPLPQYDRPPLNEVVLGVQFEPLQQLRTATVGLYWSRIRDRYPRTEDQAPLLPVVEKPLAPQQGEVVVRQVPFTAPRCWFLAEEGQQGQRLIQLQRDRFLRNWRQVRGDEEYPRFVTLADEFQQEWKDFLQFADENLGPVTVNQCELTYVNYIKMPSGSGLDFSDLPAVFPAMGARVDSLPTPELVNWTIRYPLPDDRGRLHVQMEPGFRPPALDFVLILTLTARGAPKGGAAEDIIGWFNLAHERIVKTFDELTGPKMHQLWGKKS
jgi:uncharacterized protein (TIGR04255 family)